MLKRVALVLGLAAAASAAPALAATTVSTTTVNAAAKMATTTIFADVKEFTPTYVYNGDTPVAMTRSVSTGSGMTALNMTVSAWSATLDSTTASPTDYVMNQAYLGQYIGGGFGVINSTEGDGSNNQHQIDNTSKVDFLLLEFSEAVSLKSIGRTSYAFPGNGYALDNDAAVSAVMPTMTTTTANTKITTTRTDTYSSAGVRTKIGASTDTRGATTTSTANTAVQPTTTAQLLKVNVPATTTSPSVVTQNPTSGTNRVVKSEKTETVKTDTARVDSSKFKEVKSCLASVAASCNTANTTTSSTTAAKSSGVSGDIVLKATSGDVIMSKTWLVGASFMNGDKAPDGFKLASIQVTFAVLPEPQTWAMMVLGFGFVGGAMRRKVRRAAMSA